jgi:hypothetical protein
MNASDKFQSPYEDWCLLDKEANDDCTSSERISVPLRGLMSLRHGKNLTAGSPNTRFQSPRGD